MADGDVATLGHAVLDDIDVGQALEIAQNGLLRGENGLIVLAHDHVDAHKEAGQQHVGGVGELGAQRDGVGGLIHVHAGEVEVTGGGIVGAVVHGERGLDVGGRHVLEIAAFPELLLQGIQIVGRLRHFHVHGVGLVDGGKRRSLTCGEQSAHGEVAEGDAAAYGSAHLGAAVVDFRGVHGGLARLHGGLGLTQRGLHIIVVLLTDGLGLQHAGGAAFTKLRHVEIGLGAREIGAGLVESGLVGVGFDAVEHVAFLDHGAFGEAAFLEDAAHFGTNFSPAVGYGAARKLALNVHLVRSQLDGGHARHAGLGRLSGVVLLGNEAAQLIAADKEEGKRQQSGRKLKKSGHYGMLLE